MVIGVTGKYCAGKNGVTDILLDRGFSVIDVDKLGHEAHLHRKEEIISHFGKDILTAENLIDRKKLGALVFKDKKEMAALESIVHPWMRERVKEILGSSGREVNWIINAALLFPIHLDVLCNSVFWVHSPVIKRFFRALKRDRLTCAGVLQRFRSQKQLSANSCAKDVDIYYIANTRGFEKLEIEVDRALQSLL